MSKVLMSLGAGGLIAGFTCVDSVNSLATITAAAFALGVGFILPIFKEKK